MSNKKLDALYDVVENLKYQWDDYFKLQSISQSDFNKVDNILSELRRERLLSHDDYRICRNMYHHLYRNTYKIIRLHRENPRVIASKFLSKKNVRRLVFTRDGYKCLCCGSTKKLSLDHIVAVNRGGLNRIGNLQTLCSSCNSRKSDNFKDFRNG